MTSIRTLALVAALTSSSLEAAHADPISKFLSGSGTLVYVAGGTLASLFEEGSQGKEHTLRTADSLLTTALFTEALKATVREKRPRADTPNSFPSGHTSAAFAVATMESHYHPNQAPLWFLGATAIGISRVTLHRHYVHDVLAGAALGYFTSKWELHAKHGLILSPIIRQVDGNDSRSRRLSSVGLGLSGTF